MKDHLKERASRLRRQQAEKSLYAFAVTYLSHHLKHEPSLAHREVYDILKCAFEKPGMKFALAAPRKFGKSTMLTLIAVLYSICYKKDQFIVILSETKGQACRILDNVKHELLSKKLGEDFPEVCEMGEPPRPPRWRENDIITKNGIQVLALGVDQKIRGRRHGIHRPTSVYCDDIESEKSVRSAELREKLKNWFTKAVLKAGDENTNFFFLGNLHHKGCLLADYIDPSKHIDWAKKTFKALLKEPQTTVHLDKWRSIRCGQSVYKNRIGPAAASEYWRDFKAEIEKGAETLWPDRWSIESLIEERENDPVTFASEMQNEPLGLGTLIFDLSQHEPWSRQYPSLESLIREIGQHREFYAACDPAIGSGDYSAVVVLLKDKRTKVHYVVWADIGRYESHVLIKNIVDIQERFGCVSFGLETNNFQGLLVPAVQHEAAMRQVHLPLVEIKNSGDKIKRIASLQSYFKIGLLKLNDKDVTLWQQLEELPQGKYDDGPDALEMAFRLAFQAGDAALTISSTMRTSPETDPDHSVGNDFTDREFLEELTEDSPSDRAVREIKVL